MQTHNPTPPATDFADIKTSLSYIPRPGKEAAIRHVLCASDGDVKVSARLVTLQGGAGAGKTQLARACCRSLVANFPGGTAWVALALLTDTSPDAVAEAVAREVGLVPNPTGAITPRLVAHLHSRPPMLIILDDTDAVPCESLAPLLAELLAMSQVHILATSRTPHDLGGHVVSLYEGLRPNEATTLFLERAYCRGKSGPTADSPGLPALLEGVGYHPFAVELVAAWWHKYPDAAALGAHFGKGNVQSVLQAAWRDLGQEEGGADALKALLAGALFADTFDTAALGATLGWADGVRVARTVALLQGAAFIAPVGNTDALLPRYQMPRLMQTFGRGDDYRAATNAVRLAELPYPDDLRRSFITYFDAITRRHAARLILPEGEADRKIMDTEWGNVQQALAYASTCDTARIITIGNNMGTYCRLRSRWRQWEAVGNTTVAASRITGDRANEAVALNNQGVMYQDTGRYEQATASFDMARLLKKNLGDKHGEARLLASIGEVYRLQKQWAKAVVAHDTAQRIYQALGNHSDAAATLNNLGASYLEAGQWEAEKTYYAALKINRRLGDQKGQAITLRNLGVVYHQQNQWGKAIRYFKAAYRIHQRFGDRVYEAEMLVGLGLAYTAHGRLDKAATRYQEAVGIRQEMGNLFEEGETLNSLAGVYCRQGEHDKAMAGYKRALLISRELGNLRNEGMILGNMGTVYSDQKQWGEALDHHEEALRISRELRAQKPEAVALHNVGIIYGEQEMHEEALMAYAASIKIKKGLGDENGVALTRLNRGVVYRKQDLYGKAIEEYNFALETARALNNRRLGGAALLNFAYLRVQQGCFEEAVLLARRGLVLAKLVQDKKLIVEGWDTLQKGAAGSGGKRN